MKKIIFVTTRFPYPVLGGFENKNLQLLKILASKYHVVAHFIQFKNVNSDDVRKLTNLGIVVHIHKPNLLSIFFGLILSLLKGWPFQCGLYYMKSVKHSILSDLSPNTAFFCSVIRSAPYILDLKAPKLFDLADSLGQVYASSKNSIGGLYSIIYSIEAPRLLNLENNIAANSNGMFLFNSLEAKIFKNHKNVHVVPHGVSDHLFSIDTFDHSYSDGIAIIGKMDVIHNINMVNWFAVNVLPLLPNDVKFYVIGDNPHQSLIKLSQKDNRIILTGFLPDPYLVLRSSIACVCPLQIGGGIQNKILESLAIGALVISSSKAITALPDISDSGIVICDSPSEWVNVIANAKEFPADFTNNRNLGRDYAKKYFSWNAYGNKIIDVTENSFKSIN